jgi:hypothetical protein
VILVAAACSHPAHHASSAAGPERPPGTLALPTTLGAGSTGTGAGGGGSGGGGSGGGGSGGGGSEGPGPTAPPSEHIAIPAPGADGTVPVAQWPDACTLLTDADLRVLVPTAGGASRTGQHLELPSGGESTGYTSCDYGLIGTKASAAFPPDRITVDLRAIGTHASVLRLFTADESQARSASPGQTVAYGTSLGADDSFWDGSAVESVTGEVEFWVSGAPSQGGTTTWRDQVLTRAVSLLSSKLR